MAATPMSARAAVKWASDQLGGVVASPVAEAETILGHLLGCSRTELYLQPDEPSLDADEIEKLERLVGERRRLTPLQYLTGVQQFRGLRLAVGPGVLVPRPETELVVERALELIGDIRRPLVADLGTGSGAIALSVASERPDAEVWATEIDGRALKWAERNVGTVEAGRRVRLLAGDLLSPLPHELKGHLDLVISNPPYLSDQEFETLPIDVRDHEPRVALVSDWRGVQASIRVIRESLDWLKPRGWLVLETNGERWADLIAATKVHYREVSLNRDFNGCIRILEGRKP